jgi:oligosaccharide repeat unit polymerase
MTLASSQYGRKPARASGGGSSQMRAASALAAPKMGAATGVIVAGIIITAISMPSGNAEQTFEYAAVGVGLALGLATAIEAMAGLRALLRTDLVMLATLYGLTFLEFVLPRREIFGFAVSPQGAYDASVAVMLGFAGIAIGRHLWGQPKIAAAMRAPLPLDLPPETMFTVLLLAFGVGYLHVFLAVNFNVFEAMWYMAQPRFAQPWGRGRLGGWADLLVEVGALIYLIPPLVGVMLAQLHRYSMLQRGAAAVIFLFTLYFGFSSGTRNIFGVYMLTFSGAYLAMKPQITMRQIVFFALPVSAIALVGMYFMLEFRNVGLEGYSFTEAEFNGIFVDSNMVVIANLTEVFPSIHNYLGLEIPYVALIRPIPRAIWPGKPEGLSVGIEEAVGTDGSLTLASTFVGECYMAGGMVGVLAFALLFGAAAGRWNQVGRDLRSNYNLILFVSGFFCAALLMRSLLSAAPTVLPTLGLWVYGKLFLEKGRGTGKFRAARNLASRSPGQRASRQ